MGKGQKMTTVTCINCRSTVEGYTRRSMCWKCYKAERRASCRRFLTAVKLTSGCVDCGYRDNPYALQFDHVRGPNNHKNNALAQTVNLARLVELLDICDVRCANCHAIRHEGGYHGNTAWNAPIKKEVTA